MTAARIAGGLLAALLSGCLEYRPVFQGPVGPPAADAVPDGFVLDRFTGAEAPQVDVIVFADTSGSMEREVVRLGQRVAPFVARLATHARDWRLAAVTGDGGCTASGVLRPSTPDFAGVFASALSQRVVCGSETGLLDVARAVEGSLEGDCNEGLVRGGALHVLYISDENDESPGFDADAAYWRAYLARIEAVHGDPSRIRMSAVIGMPPLGCAGAAPGFGYHEIVQATGGELLSICDDWSTQLDAVADNALLRSRFPLSAVPDPDTLRVWVNEAALNPGRGFTWEPALRSVRLQVPAEGGDTVSVLYVPAAVR